MESYRVILFTFFGKCGLLHVCLNANRLFITRGETASGVSLGDLIKGDATTSLMEFHFVDSPLCPRHWLGNLAGMQLSLPSLSYFSTSCRNIS